MQIEYQGATCVLGDDVAAALHLEQIRLQLHEEVVGAGAAVRPQHLAPQAV